MNWPSELVAAFDRALEFEPIGPLDRQGVLRWILDETARRAVWRARGDPSRLSVALRTPFTPLGSVVPGGVMSMVGKICLHGPRWGPAVDAFHGYIEEHAAVICAEFEDAMVPYDSDIGFGL